MKCKSFFSLSIIIMVASLWLFCWSLDIQAAELPSRRLLINGQVCEVEIAQNDAQRAQGLSGSNPLADNTGMLFLFAKPGNYIFWMKDMRFPLDMIWIKSHKVVGITADAAIPTQGMTLQD